MVSYQKSKLFDTLSSFTSIGGFLISLSKIFIYIPILNVASSFLFLVSNIFWLVANRLLPKQKPRQDRWYGFADFRDQISWAAILSATASILSIVAIFINPLFYMVAASITIVANILWSVGEYHKAKNPPENDPQFNIKKQYLMTEHALTMLGISILSAGLTAIGVFFPPLLMSSIFIIAPTGIFLIGYAIQNLIKMFKLPNSTQTNQGRSNSHALMFERGLTPDNHSPQQGIELTNVQQYPSPLSSGSKAPRESTPDIEDTGRLGLTTS